MNSVRGRSELLCSPAILDGGGASQQRSRKARERAGVGGVDRSSGPDGLGDGDEGRQGGRVARHVVRHVGDLEVNEFSAVLLLPACR